MNPEIGLSSSSRELVVASLRRLLADEMVLALKTRSFHWNVTGRTFHSLHELFEEQYEAIADTVDEVAERIRSLGFISPGSMAEFMGLARLAEQAGVAMPAEAMLAALLADHEALARSLRADVEAAAAAGDAGTSDFLTGLLEAHEKAAWMLRAHLG